MPYPQIKVLERNRGSRLLSTLYSLKRNIAESLSQSLPESQAALAYGVILGGRSGIPSSVKDDILRIAGQPISLPSPVSILVSLLPC